MSRLSSIATQITGIFRRRSEQPRLVPKPVEAIAGEVLLDYSVGAYRIRIIRDFRGEIIYNVSTTVPEELREKVRTKMRDIIMMMTTATDVNTMLAKVLGIRKQDTVLAYMALKEEMRYRMIQPLIDDPYIEDISITGSGYVWIRHSQITSMYPEIDMIRTNIFLSERDVDELQLVIASRCKTYVSTSNPIVDTQLPAEDGGHRVHMVARNVSSRPEIIIRRVRKQFQTIEDLLEIGSINRAFVEYVKALIERRGSMIIAGPPGSGKTTLLRSILYSLIPKGWKIAIIEDTAEIDPPHGSSWTRYTSFELGRVKVDLFDLAKASLRSSAQILLVVGEVRGSEAQVLAQAMLAGTGGLTTFHGGTPEEVITRLRSHPIGLSNSQISMFWSIAFMGFQQENPRRVLRRVVELLPRGDDPPEVVNLYDISVDGRDPNPMLLISRSKRLRG